MKNKYYHLIGCMAVVLASIINIDSVAASDRPMTAEELEKWFNSDEEPVDPLKLINEGELVFLKQQPEVKAHQAKHILTLLPDSLRDGWVMLEQCHENLDVMPAAQVVFMGKRVRNLKIVSSTHIGKAWVEDDTIQLKNIARHARLCLQVETKALWKKADGHYSLRTGPYQRKFLDGYFPMNLLLEINYPKDVLRFKSIVPKVQAGLSVSENTGSIKINALFEGQLHLNMLFNKK